VRGNISGHDGPAPDNAFIADMDARHNDRSGSNKAIAADIRICMQETRYVVSQNDSVKSNAGVGTDMNAAGVGEVKIGL
jgi:hypothetical protein